MSYPPPTTDVERPDLDVIPASVSSDPMPASAAALVIRHVNKLPHQGPLNAHQVKAYVVYAATLDHSYLVGAPLYRHRLLCLAIYSRLYQRFRLDVPRYRVTPTMANRLVLLRCHRVILDAHLALRSPVHHPVAPDTDNLAANYEALRGNVTELLMLAYRECPYLTPDEEPSEAHVLRMTITIPAHLAVITAQLGKKRMIVGDVPSCDDAPMDDASAAAPSSSSSSVALPSSSSAAPSSSSSSASVIVPLSPSAAASSSSSLATVASSSSSSSSRVALPSSSSSSRLGLHARSSSFEEEEPEALDPNAAAAPSSSSSLSSRRQRRRLVISSSAAAASSSDDAAASSSSSSSALSFCGEEEPLSGADDDDDTALALPDVGGIPFVGAVSQHPDYAILQHLIGVGVGRPIVTLSSGPLYRRALRALLLLSPATLAVLRQRLPPPPPPAEDVIAHLRSDAIKDRYTDLWRMLMTFDRFVRGCAGLPHIRVPSTYQAAAKEDATIDPRMNLIFAQPIGDILLRVLAAGAPGKWPSDERERILDRFFFVASLVARNTLTRAGLDALEPIVVEPYEQLGRRVLTRLGLVCLMTCEQFFRAALHIYSVVFPSEQPQRRHPSHDICSEGLPTQQHARNMMSFAAALDSLSAAVATARATIQESMLPPPSSSAEAASSSSSADAASSAPPSAEVNVDDVYVAYFLPAVGEPIPPDVVRLSTFIGGHGHHAAGKLTSTELRDLKRVVSRMTQLGQSELMRRIPPEIQRPYLLPVSYRGRHAALDVIIEFLQLSVRRALKYDDADTSGDDDAALSATSHLFLAGTVHVAAQGMVSRLPESVDRCRLVSIVYHVSVLLARATLVTPAGHPCSLQCVFLPNPESAPVARRLSYITAMPLRNFLLFADHLLSILDPVFIGMFMRSNEGSVGHLLSTRSSVPVLNLLATYMARVSKSRDPEKARLTSLAKACSLPLTSVDLGSVDAPIDVTAASPSASSSSSLLDVQPTHLHHFVVSGSTSECCSLILDPSSAYGWTCDLCDTAFSAASRSPRYHCSHERDICQACGDDLLSRRLTLLSVGEVRPVPVDEWGRPCYLESEYSLFVRTRSDARSSSGVWEIRPTAFVRVWHPVSHAIVISVRCDYFGAVTERFHSVGIMGTSSLSMPRWYPRLSSLWLLDPLSVKSLTCSSCGHSTYCAYYCSDRSCHHGLCMDCYSRVAYPDEMFTNFPSTSQYRLLPCASSCAASLPHVTAPGRIDLSFVIETIIIINISGLGGDEPSGGRRSTNKSLSMHNVFDTDRTLVPGFGVYVYTINYTQNMQSGVHGSFNTRLREIMASIVDVRARALFIHISGHRSSVGYFLGNSVYSASQLVSSIIVPIVSSFRSSQGRDSNRVVVMLNICELRSSTWLPLVQSQPPLQRFELIMHRNPVNIAYMPLHVGSFLREWANALRWRDPSYNTASAIRDSLSVRAIEAMRPVLITHGGVDSTCGLAVDTFVASPLLVGAVVVPPVVLLPFTSRHRDALILSHIASFTPDERAIHGLSMVMHTQLRSRLVEFSVRLTPPGYVVPAVTDQRSFLRTWNRFIQTHWRMTPASGIFIWAADIDVAAIVEVASSIDVAAPSPLRIVVPSPVDPVAADVASPLSSSTFTVVSRSPPPPLESPPPPLDSPLALFDIDDMRDDLLHSPRGLSSPHSPSLPLVTMDDDSPLPDLETVSPRALEAQFAAQSAVAAADAADAAATAAERIALVYAVAAAAAPLHIPSIDVMD